MKIKQYHTHRVSAPARTLLAACAMVGFAFSASAAEPLYRWNFNAGDGANTGTASGGTLSANVGGGTTGAFTGTGVSGTVGDSSFHASNANDNWWGTDLGNAAAVSSLDLSSLTQFTITLWIKRSGGNNADVLNIGSTATPDSASNPGISVGLYGTWDNGVSIGVNGYSAGAGDLWSTGTDNDWVFMAFAYDGNAGIWWAPDMNTLYGQHRNAVVVTGDTVTSATTVVGVPVHVGDWSTAAGAPSVGATASVFFANNAAGTTGYSGDLDDIRIYGSLLTLSEIEAIRLEAAPVAIPEPSSAALLLGGFGLFAALGRRRETRR